MKNNQLYHLLFSLVICFGLLLSSTLNAQESCPTGTDIHIANDVSGSVDSREFQQSKDFVSLLGANFGTAYGTGNLETRVSISNWSRGSGRFVEYDFPSAGQNYATSIGDILSYTTSARPFRGGTDVYTALLRAREWVNQNPVSGRDVPKVIVLLTDARCFQVANNISTLATQIKNQGVYIIVLAIDNAAGCTNLSGTNVASPGGYFNAADYATLSSQAISFINSLRDATCDPGDPPPPAPFDLTVSLSNFSIINCDTTPSASADIQVTNNSGGDDFSGNLQVSFYNGNPTIPSTQYLFTESFGSQTIASGGGTYTNTITNTALTSASTLYAVVNYDGSVSGNEVPLSYSNLDNEIAVTGEGIVNNNISSPASRTDGTGCLPFANIDTRVTNNGVGCDDKVIYTIEVCNTGTADAVMTSDDVAFYPPPGAVLLESRLNGSPTTGSGSTTLVDAPTSVTYTPGGNSIPNANGGRRVQVSGSEDGSTFAASGSFGGAVYDFDQGGGSWVQRGTFFSGGPVDMSMSSDGNTVSAVYNSNVLRVFDWNGSSWVQRGADMLGDAGATLIEESISGDGNTVVMVDDSNNEHKVFRWDGTAWQQLGSDFDGLGTLIFNLTFTYGRTALSADGNTLLIGGLDNGNVFIYDWNGTNWTQRGTTLSEFAINVDMTANGNTIILSDFGPATVFDWDGSSWVQRSQPIVNYASGGFDQGVSSVSISDDGNTAVLGINDGGSSRIQVYTFINDLWVLVSLAPDPGIGETVAVDIAGDGSRLFFGESNISSNSGSEVEAFDINTSTVEISNPPPSVPTSITDSPGTFSFGRLPGGDGQAALSEDGNTYAICSRFSGGFAAVYDFDAGTTSWVQRGAFLPSATDVGLSNDGNTLSLATNSQSLLVYDWNGSSWVQRGSNILADAGGMVWETALSADGNTVSLSDSDDQDCKIFRWDGTAWQQLGGDIAANVGAAFTSVADYGKTALSADGNTFGTTDAVYDWNGSSWVQRGSLPSSGSSMDLSADGNIIVIDFVVYEWDGTNWTQRGTVPYPGPQERITSVAISDDGNTIVNVEFGSVMRTQVFVWVDLNWYYVGSDRGEVGELAAAIEIAGNGSRYMANTAEVSSPSLIARDIGGFSVSTLAAGDCFTYQRTYDVSALAAGSYDYSVGVRASAQAGDDPVNFSPDNGFSAGSDTGLNGFDGSVQSTDDLSYGGSSLPCNSGDQISIALSLVDDPGFCAGDFSTATLTITNTSGFDISGTLLNLDLSGTDAIFNGEPYNLTNGLVLAEPDIFDPAYPSVPNALSGTSGVQSLDIFTLPNGTSTFNIDVIVGSPSTTLSADVTLLPANVNTSGATNTASDNVSVGVQPEITLTCPASAAATDTTISIPFTEADAASVTWRSGSNGTFAGGSPQVYNINDIDRANGFVEISAEAQSADNCLALASCRIDITGSVYDFGDAPSSYDFGEIALPVAAASTINSDIYLGSTPPDAESAAIPTADASGDGADEDAVSNLIYSYSGNGTYTLSALATNNSLQAAYLYGYIDWNGDGDFLGDEGEVSGMVTVPAGSGLSSYAVEFTVPQNVSYMNAIVRLRLSTDEFAAARSFGASANGEVEDHTSRLDTDGDEEPDEDDIDDDNDGVLDVAEQALSTSNATVIDNFDSNNSSGGSGWSSDWVTTGGAAFTGSELFMNGGTAKTATRSVDLTNATSAVLTVDGRCQDSSSGWEPADTISVEISYDGGLSFVTLATRNGDQICPSSNDIESQTFGPFNITTGNPDTRIRLAKNASSGSEDYYWTEVEIVQETTTLADVDTDNDGVPDRLDLDSDGDGIADIIEAGGVDTNNDGEVDYPTVGDPTSMIDANNNGWSSVFDDGSGDALATEGGTPLTDPDSDSDTVLNRLDLDSDDDAIPDNIEGQSTGGYTAPSGTSFRDGFDTSYPGGLTPVDTDGDATPDYLDGDSDNDGLTDVDENYIPVIAVTTVGTNGLEDAADTADDYSDVNGITHDGTSFSASFADTDADVSSGGDYDYRDLNETVNLFGTRIISSLQNGTVTPNKIDAYLNIVSNNWGVVITRVNGVASITNVVEGMLVFDTSDNTFKVNTDGTATGWRALKE